MPPESLLNRVPSPNPLRFFRRPAVWLAPSVTRRRKVFLRKSQGSCRAGGYSSRTRPQCHGGSIHLAFHIRHTTDRQGSSKKDLPESTSEISFRTRPRSHRRPTHPRAKHPQAAEPVSRRKRPHRRPCERPSQLAHQLAHRLGGPLSQIPGPGRLRRVGVDVHVSHFCLKFFPLPGC
jgi:hypothetical protein